jgi:glutamine synthetase
MTNTTPSTTIKIFCEYIWLDGSGGLRSKNRVLNRKNANTITVEEIPDWNYDGSSTGQATTESSEIILKAAAIYKDPFMTNLPFSYLVLCDTYGLDGKPHATNTRVIAKQIFDKYTSQIPWYGIEQEFFILNTKTGRPIGFPENCQYYPKPQENYYCGVGGENAFGRSFVLDVYKKCIDSGLSVSGSNGEVAPGQWEIQIGPCVGIDAADQLYILRYILKRTSELYDNLCIDFSSKPVNSVHWNGSGAHTNFSTEQMRQSGGLAVIQKAVARLSKRHKEHILVYGDDNNLRLTGKLETSSMHHFSSGVGDRSASIRIPTQTAKDGFGYFEDRRPSASCDPYKVTSIILETINS